MPTLLTIHLPMEERALKLITREAGWTWPNAVVTRTEEAWIYSQPEPEAEASSLPAVEVEEAAELMNKLLLRRRLVRFYADPEHVGHILVDTIVKDTESRLRISPRYLSNGQISISVAAVPNAEVRDRYESGAPIQNQPSKLP